MNFIMTCVWLGIGGLLGGAAAIDHGHYVGGPLLILGGLFFCWALYIARQPRTFPYAQETCPHRGERPAYGMFKGGFHWWMRSLGEDDSPVAECTDCGFITSAFGERVNPLTAHVTNTRSEGPPVHP